MGGGTDTMVTCRINIEDARSWQVHQPTTNSTNTVVTSPAGVLGEGSGEGALVGGALMGGGTDTMVTCRINIEDARSWQVHQPTTNTEMSSPAGVLGEGSGEGALVGGGTDGRGH